MCSALSKVFQSAVIEKLQLVCLKIWGLSYHFMSFCLQSYVIYMTFNSVLLCDVSVLLASLTVL